MRTARREVAEAQARLQTVEAALAAARSSKRWLEEAKRAVSSGDARFGDHPLDLAQYVIGYKDKLSALSATMERLEEEMRMAAAALREAQARAVRSRTPLGGQSVPDADTEAEVTSVQDCVISKTE